MFNAPIALGACVAPLGTHRLLIAAAALTGNEEKAVVEEHATSQSDGARRATLLTLQVLRENLIG
jgi:hypothetical protein